MTPHTQGPGVTVYAGDCLEVLTRDELGYDYRLGYAPPMIPDSSVDSVTTDPPYGLGFMGREWDALPPGREWAEECLRVLKPGGHLLAFGGTRTWHRLACAVEDAGFEVRDSIAWLYGSGFPKSLDVSKAIDKAAGAAREVVGPHRWAAVRGDGSATRTDLYDGGAEGRRGSMVETAPATDDARTWQGWGTALKPAFEPIVVARKPLVGTVASNVLAHGTGALNIDGGRVGEPSEVKPQIRPTTDEGGGSWSKGEHVPFHYPPGGGGRWPANVILDESQAAALDAQSGESTAGSGPFMRRATLNQQSDVNIAGRSEEVAGVGHGDTGGASRFFYVAKAGADERVRVNGTAHPTVKPLALMRWLVRLVTPPGGTVLEPFAGSGTTVEACILEGFRCIAIEREADYLPLIQQRINRRRDPVAAIKATGDDGGLFDLLDGGAA